MNICLIAHFAYGALTGEEVGHIGGVERQAALFSEWLSNQGHNVSVITWGEGDLTQVGKVRIIKLCRQIDGIPGLRFFYPRWSSLNEALKEADADVYYQNCAEYVTGQVALWCRQNNRPFVYSVASDADCDSHLPNLEHWRARALFRYGLKNADLVIAQTHNQVEMLKRNFDVSATVIRMPGTPPTIDSRYSDRSRFNEKKVIWVARVDPVKRIDWIIDIARAVPEVAFEVIGPLDESEETGIQIRQKMDETPNLKFAGKVMRSDMPDKYQQASLLCCTSIYEGFPNTYLEAWSYGIPVVTTIDPDGLIMHHEMGFASSSKDQLVKSIVRILNDEAYWLKLAGNAKTYYQANHLLDPIQKSFEYQLARLNRYGATIQHFENESQQWSDYYVDQVESLSHLDVQARLRHVSKFMKNGPKRSSSCVLDIGCGTGDAIRYLPGDKNIDVISADYSFGMVKRTMTNFDNARGLVADALAVPMPDSSFNYVLALGVFEYIEKFECAIAESRRVLSNSGELILSVPNRLSIFRKLRVLETSVVKPIKLAVQLLFDAKSSDNYYHHQWYPEEIEGIIEHNGFEIVDIQYCTYGFLSPKLTSAAFNLKLCKFLNQNLGLHKKLQKYLAHTIVIHARKV